MQRETGSMEEAYDTGSTITYGYGDSPIYWTGSDNTGSWIKVFVFPMKADEVVVEAGFDATDYRKAVMSGSTSLALWDLLLYPSGSAQQMFLIRPIQEYVVSNELTLLKEVQLRSLLPSS